MTATQTSITANLTDLTDLTRTVNGRSAPLPGEYAIDASHTSVGFVARHLMISKVRGRFGDVAGVIRIDEVPENSSVEVEIDVTALTSGDPTRDGHLKGDDFFDVERFPKAGFRSTAVEADGDRWKVTGDLTIKDVTRPVVLRVEFDGAERSPYGGYSLGFSASAEVDRETWGLTWNQALETGGVLVGKTAKLELEVEAHRQ